MAGPRLYDIATGYDAILVGQEQAAAAQRKAEEKKAAEEKNSQTDAVRSQLMNMINTPVQQASINTSGIPSSQLTDWARSQTPRSNLQGYTGNTQVNMSPETVAMLQQILGFTQGSNFQNMLSGQTNQGLFQRGVVDPMQRQFNQTVLPGIQDAYSGGPQGGGSAFWGGARAKAEQQSRNSLNDQIAGLRYQDYNNAQNRSLQAGSMLPALSQAMSLREQLAGENMNRAIDVHYKNQGLKSQQFNEDLAFINSLFGQQNSSNQLAVTQRGQDIAQQQDLRGNLLALLGLDQNLNIANSNNATSMNNAALAANASMANAAMGAGASQANTAAQIAAAQNPNSPQNQLTLQQTLNSQIGNQAGQIYLQRLLSQMSGAQTLSPVGTISAGGSSWGYQPAIQSAVPSMDSSVLKALLNSGATTYSE